MTNWNVFRELDNLRREIDDAFRGAGISRPYEGPLFAPAGRKFPLVNLSEDEGNVYVDALLPGVAPQDTDLSVVRNVLSISGERKPFSEQQGQIVHRSELGSGRFSRTIELPEDVDTDKVSAEYRDGILRITLVKAEHAKPKKIAINLS
jgi:HSP20 family protein